MCARAIHKALGRCACVCVVRVRRRGFLTCQLSNSVCDACKCTYTLRWECARDIYIYICSCVLEPAIVAIEIKYISIIVCMCVAYAYAIGVCSRLRIGVTDSCSYCWYYCRRCCFCWFFLFCVHFSFFVFSFFSFSKTALSIISPNL